MGGAFSVGENYGGNATASAKFVLGIAVVMSGAELAMGKAYGATCIPAQQMSLRALKQLSHIINAKNHIINLLCGVFAHQKEWRYGALRREI